MKTLAFDTTSDRLSVAAGRSGGPVAVREVAEHLAHVPGTGRLVELQSFVADRADEVPDGRRRLSQDGARFRQIEHETIASQPPVRAHELFSSR